ncbi:hypothetical protein OVA03_14230 [Asticcacaulis sp. SL142]|uniref:hypothetical protein n=1 Tax=Asticcacaulis sp. SL142 TaxID=2995155 RepID=UPI00226C7C69|nr:hypothetical protein [Asticcacaulis sp. SL142]WAC47846.1 hypothetical protein OVA03_14230 [Asticcacaulis sp. SL142]
MSAVITVAGKDHDSAHESFLHILGVIKANPNKISIEIDQMVDQGVFFGTNGTGFPFPIPINTGGSLFDPVKVWIISAIVL